MFSFLSHEKKGELSLLIEVQSGLVRGSLVAYGQSDQENIHIIYVTSTAFVGSTHTTGALLVKAMLKSVHQTLESISKEGMERASQYGFDRKDAVRVHLVLSSPWIISESKTLHTTYEKDTEISKKIIQELCQAEQDTLSKKYSVSDAKNIEQKIFEITLNGYAVKNFVGKKTRQLEVSFVTSIASQKILQKIDAAFYHMAHISQKEYHSALLLQYIALRSLPSIAHEYIYVHIHDELTDVIIVKNGLCIHIASFPFGIHTLLQKVSVSLKQTVETSDSSLKLSYSDQLHASEGKAIKDVASLVIQKWKSAFFDILTSTSDIGLVPRTVYISAHSHFDIFKDIIVMENRYNFDIIPFNTVPHGGNVHFEKGSEHSQMVEMYARALKDMI